MLSVIVITKNEASNINTCLSSVNWANEIIILDCGSSDNTVDLCKAYTNKIFITDWPGFGIQKQRALDKASCEWVLSIDADEQVSPQLKSEILQIITDKDNKFCGFEVYRISSYYGKNIKYGGWGKDYILRLFKRNNGKFSPDLVHERVIVDGAVTKLHSPLWHESFVNSYEVLYKINQYSTLGAQKLLATDKNSSLSKAIIKGLWSFFCGYILKFGFLDGKYGLMLAISNAEGTYYKYLKLMELNGGLKK